MGFFSFIGDIVDGIGDAIGGVGEAVGDIVTDVVDVVGDFARSDIGRIASLFLPTPVSLALTATAFVDAKYIDMPEMREKYLLQKAEYIKKQMIEKQAAFAQPNVSPMSALQTVQQTAQQFPGVADTRILESWARVRTTNNPAIRSSLADVAPNLVMSPEQSTSLAEATIEIDDEAEDITAEESGFSPPVIEDAQSSITLSSAEIETDEDEEEV